MPEEQRSFAEFSDPAREFYESLTDVVSVVGLWEQLAYIADYGEIDHEMITEYISDDGFGKVIMGPLFYIIFDNAPHGRMAVYHIQRSSFRRPR